MHYLLRAIRAETAKTRRTLALSLTFIAPVVVAGLQFCLLLQYQPGPTEPSGGEWESTISSVMMLWALLMLPLFVTLETALTAAIDHNSRAWKWLFSLPLPRWSHYAAKLLVNVALIGLSTAVMAAVAPIVGMGMRLFRPGRGYEAAIPWAFIGETAVLTFAAALLIIALHTYVAMRWHSFVVASSLGIVATVAAVMLLNSEYVDKYPWTLPGYAAMTLRDTGIAWRTLVLSTTGALLVTLAGCWDFCRQDAA